MLHWLTEGSKVLRSLLHQVTGEVRGLLEKAKFSPIEKTKPVMVRQSLQIPERQGHDHGRSLPDTKNSDRIFQIGIVGLGVCFIGLIIGGVIYLIILWVMR